MARKFLVGISSSMQMFVTDIIVSYPKHWPFVFQKIYARIIAPDKALFNKKVLIVFLFVHKNCGYLLEAPH